MDHGTKRRSSMIDVAKLAGVSHQTVSRVINDSPRVSEETRTKVLAAIAQLDYRPNSSARSLVTSTSKTIGIITTGMQYHGAPETLEGISQRANKAGYFTSVINVEPDPDYIRKAIDQMLNQVVAGMILLAPQRLSLNAFQVHTVDIPAIIVESSDTGGLHSVPLDQEEGAILATQHLIDLGHRRILHVAGPSEWSASNVRLSGWQRTMAEAGLVAPVPLVGDWSAASGYQIGKELVQRQDFTAVFCANDQMALGAIHAFSEAGLQVPSDISVVGYDDMPESPYFLPSLTTVRLNYFEMGQHSVNLLLQRLKVQTESPSTVSMPELVVRGSTAAPTR